MKHAPIAFTLMALFALAGCGKKEEPVAQTPDTMAPTPPVAAPSGAPSTASDGASDAARIKYGSVCAGCHGQQGQGQATFPKLAGQSAEQIAAKLRDYKAGKTLGAQSAMMAPTAQALSDTDIDALATYIAALPK